MARATQDQHDRGDPPGPSADELSSLKGLLDNLGRDVIQVVAARGGVDVLVGEPVIYDPGERTAISRDAVVLAVGVRAGTAEGDRLIAAAAQGGAAAVVFKTTPELADLARDLGSHDVAVLAVPEEMTWTQLHALLNLGRFAAATGDASIAGVPLGDLFALANAIAGVVGGAVTVEDPVRRVLAYSTLGDQPIDAARRGSILGRQVPDSPGMRTLYRQVLATPGVMTVDGATLREMLEGGPSEVDDVKSRSAVAIRAGSHMIGSIWVIHDADRLDEESEHALAEAARIAVPHVIQARAARDVERRLRAEMLLTVLEGRGSVDEAAARLGFAASTPFAIIAFEAANGEAGIDELQRERLVDLVVVHCEATSRQTSAVALGQIVYALLQGETLLDQRALLRLAQQVQEHAETRLGLELLGAVGPAVEGIREVARARRDVERVLGVLRADAGGRTVASADQVRSEVILHELKELSLDHPSLTRGKLERVLAHDAQHNATYVLTLRAYLDCFGDVPRAAERLSVHPNTFRYRMRRLVELFDLDLDDADERMVLELQLRLIADGAATRPGDTSRRRS
ncbi:MAG TPA: helix-turn-helix domain-containing protein [Gaiellaceae bacterium]|nr:helix-turn-helix domain-containing protein [Gaiellaceae bacterium]